MLIPISDDNTGRQSTPYVVYTIVVLNAIVFLFFQQAGYNERFTYGYATVPYEITHNQDLVQPKAMREIPQAPGPSPIYLTILISMFMHGSWMHIIGNMLFLWVFGDNIEDNFGHARFTIFYLLSGIAATFAQIAIDPDSMIPTLGASGAIAGVLGSYLIMFPRNRVRNILPLGFIFTTIELPAVLVIGFWIVLQLIEQYVSSISTSATRGGGVAYMAHIGGFAAGGIMTFIFRRRRKTYASYDYYDR